MCCFLAPDICANNIGVYFDLLDERTSIFSNWGAIVEWHCAARRRTPHPRKARARRPGSPAVPSRAAAGPSVLHAYRGSGLKRWCRACMASAGSVWPAPQMRSVELNLKQAPPNRVVSSSNDVRAMRCSRHTNAAPQSRRGIGVKNGNRWRRSLLGLEGETRWAIDCRETRARRTTARVHMASRKRKSSSSHGFQASRR